LEDLPEALNAASDPVQAFVDRMHRFRYQNSLGGTEYPVPPSSALSPYHPLPATRAVRFKAVDAYLSDLAPGRIPITWPAPGGYDFLLSDKGLEMFVPERPKDARDLLRYYTFRATGRRAIGTPKYLEQAISATSTDTATGPGEIVFPPEVLLEIVRGGVAGPTDPACEALLRCVEIRTGLPFSSAWSLHWTELRNWGDELISSLPHLRKPDYDRRKPGRGGLPLTLEEYRCLVSGFRCWQMEGATYRGIMTEFPRVAALVWMEEIDGIPPTGSYRNRIDQPSRAREVFMERLETMIAEDMKFEPCDSTTPVLGLNWQPRWALDDVMVTNQGIFFPKVPRWNAAFGPDHLHSILAEMAGGRAGNPVFTDSMRTGPGD
jgi:hypothetical protein